MSILNRDNSCDRCHDTIELNEFCVVCEYNTGHCVACCYKDSDCITSLKTRSLYRSSILVAYEIWKDRKDVIDTSIAEREVKKPTKIARTLRQKVSEYQHNAKLFRDMVRTIYRLCVPLDKNNLAIIVTDGK